DPISRGVSNCRASINLRMFREPQALNRSTGFSKTLLPAMTPQRSALTQFYRCCSIMACGAVKSRDLRWTISIGSWDDPCHATEDATSTKLSNVGTRWRGDPALSSSGTSAESTSVSVLDSPGTNPPAVRSEHHLSGAHAVDQAGREAEPPGR